MFKYLITLIYLAFFCLNTHAQVSPSKVFDDELPIAPQIYDEYNGTTQISFQKDPIKVKKFSLLNKLKKKKKQRKLTKTNKKRKFKKNKLRKKRRQIASKKQKRKRVKRLKKKKYKAKKKK